MSGPDTTALPLEVLEALNRGGQREAVARLREAEGIGLREARDRVAAHVAANPGVREATVVRPAGAGRWVALVVMLALVAVAAAVAADLL